MFFCFFRERFIIIFLYINLRFWLLFFARVEVNHIEDNATIRGIFFFLINHNRRFRMILIQWFICFSLQLCEERECQEEVPILAINYMDRVLNKLPISKNNLQLLAATCTFLASKLREPSTHALQPEVLIYYTDNSITKRDLMVSSA